MLNKKHVENKDFIEFEKYFNRDFWRAFKDKKIFVDIPKNINEKNDLIWNLFNDIKSKKYYPSTPQCYIDRNKGNGVTRIIPVFTMKDYCLYYYCIKQLEDKIACNRVPNTFGGWTLGGLIRKSEDDEIKRKKEDYNNHEDFLAEANGISVSEYSFNPKAWAKSYGDLNSKLFATAKSKQFNWVAELDIANYYDSIKLNLLEIKIRELVDVNKADVLSLLFHFLNYWNRETNFYNKQTVGIPQDAMGDCSRILANFYLQSYDKYVYELCLKHECEYLRYADDQFLFAKNKDDLNYLIFKISKKLNSIGLSVNQKKVNLRRSNELIEYRSFEIFDIIQDKQDKSDSNKVEEFVDKYLDILDKQGLQSIKKRGYPLLNRLLFCPALKNIDLTKKSKLLGCYLDDNYLEDTKSVYLDQIYQLLFIDENKDSFINKLLSLSDHLIHNAFHYEVLNFFVKNKISSQDLIRQRIEQLKSE